MEVYCFSYLNSGLLNVWFKCQNWVSVKLRGVQTHMMLSCNVVSYFVCS